MNEYHCDRLDEFLAAELRGADRERFRAHLADCAACSAEVSAQQAIDRLLSQAVEESEPCPPVLLARVTREFRIEGRRRVARWSAGVLAACAGILAAWIVIHPPHGRHINQRRAHVIERNSIADTGPAPHESEKPGDVAVQPQDPEVIVRFPDEFIGVPIKSSLPNVTIYKVYPVIGYGQQADASSSAHPPGEGLERSQL